MKGYFLYAVFLLSHSYTVCMYTHSIMQYNIPENGNRMGWKYCLSIMICMCKKETQRQRCHQHEYGCHVLPFAAEYAFKVVKVQLSLVSYCGCMQSFHHIFLGNYVNVFQCLLHIHFMRDILAFQQICIITFLFYICVCNWVQCNTFNFIQYALVCFWCLQYLSCVIDIYACFSISDDRGFFCLRS